MCRRLKPADAIPDFLRVHDDGVLLALKVQPRASRTAFGEPLGGELRVKVSAPPVDSAANDALIELLAQTLQCSKSRVELLRGQTSRHKLVKLHGFTPAEVLAAIGRARV